MSSDGMTLKLEVWRQGGRNQAGKMVSYTAKGITPDMSFLEMLDVVNEDLIRSGKEPIEFDSDCREGICGTCGLVINGQAHGPEAGTSACQLHMRSFSDGDSITIEPFRANAFPIVKDLVIDRSAFDRIIQKGGYVSVSTGPHADANTSRFPSPPPTRHSFRRPASAAAHVLPRVRTHPPRCSPARRSASTHCFLKVSPSASVALCVWSTRWMRKASATARISVSARPCVPRASSWRISPG